MMDVSKFAFPRADSNYTDKNDKRWHALGFPGLTKREYFAGLALQGHCTLSVDDCTRYRLDPMSIAKRSVEMADELMTALNGEENDGR